MWGKLAAEILMQSWEVAMEDLGRLKEYIDSFVSILQHIFSFLLTCCVPVSYLMVLFIPVRISTILGNCYRWFVFCSTCYHYELQTFIRSGALSNVVGCATQQLRFNAKGSTRTYQSYNIRVRSLKLVISCSLSY